MIEYRFKPMAPHQTRFIKSDARYLLNSGGVGSGKTYSIVLKTLKLTAQHPGILVLIGAQTYPMLRDTTLREFINIVPAGMIASYNRTNQHFIMHNGSEVLFRPFDDAGKLKSLNLGACGIEEMTDIREDIFKMLRTRMRQADMPGCIFGATNPNTFGNWVYRNFIENPLQKSEVVYSVSSDNKYLPAEYLEDLESMKLSNPEYYERMVQGRWGSLEGVIYNLPMSHRLAEMPDKRKMSRWMAGLDFGFTHPTAFVVIGERNESYYIYDEIYRRQMTSQDIIDAIKIKMTEYDIDCIYCDSARPEIIEDLKRQGIPAIPARKDVFDGIMHVKGLIGSGRLYVSQNCTYTLREFDSYIWDARNTVKEVPVKLNDDCFIGSEKIATLRGMVKLKKIKKSDYVYTRDGFKKVLTIHTKVKTVRKYKTSITDITGTEDHPIFCLEKNDFLPISELTRKDTLCILNKEEYNKCQNQKLLSLMDLFSDGGRIPNLGIIGAISPVTATILKTGLGLFTGKYGKLNMERFQRGFVYIIKTAIRLIIRLKILSASAERNMRRTIQKSGTRTIRNAVIDTLAKYETKQRNGIGQPREGGGIQSTLKKLRLRLFLLFLNAKYVEKNIKQIRTCGKNHGSALIVASHRIDGTSELITLKRHVQDVGKSFILTSTGKTCTARRAVHVRHIGKTKRKKTYNLTVSEKPEYYVNGILVHNCQDAIRYSLFSDQASIPTGGFYEFDDRDTAKMDF